MKTLSRILNEGKVKKFKTTMKKKDFQKASKSNKSVAPKLIKAPTLWDYMSGK